MCGILQVPGYPRYADAFVPASQRAQPSQRHLFGHYPTWWWKAGHGINDAQLGKLLPQLALPGLRPGCADGTSDGGHGPRFARQDVALRH
jgi:hypothetical protein